MLEELTTYEIERSLAVWDYRVKLRFKYRDRDIDLENVQDRKIWIAEQLQELWGLFGDFCDPTNVYVTTESKGEDSCVINSQILSERLRLDQYLRSAEDVVLIEISLVLKCLLLYHETGKLQNAELPGANLWLVVDLTPDGKLDPNFDGPIRISFRLGNDIYAPRSRGKVRDNRRLSALNAPLLAAFLHRLEDNIPMDLIEVSAPAYPDMIDRYGFKLPRASSESSTSS